MPEMDGFTATGLIRANPRLAFLPIIAMTAHATVDERLRCLEAGMNEHLSKPIDVAALYDVLRVWLKSAQGEKALLGSRRLDDSPLPDLPGLDVETALERMNGNLRLYKTHLLQFLLYHAEAEEELREALAFGEPRKALRIVSSLLRHARIIGAGRLAGIASVLEAELAHERQPDEPEIRHFLDELEAVVGPLSRLYPETPAGEEPSGVDHLIFLGELSRLNALLNDDDAAACQLFAKLEPAIKQVSASAAATAAKALAVFDFAQALSVLAPMEKSLAGERAGSGDEKN